MIAIFDSKGGPTMVESQELPHWRALPFRLRGRVNRVLSLRLSTIVSPIEEGPAACAGVRPGDQLLAIDGASMDGVSLVQTVRHLRGPLGTKVVLTLRRAGSSDPLVQTLTREVILLRIVTFSRIGERYGYVRISQFNERTDTDLGSALRSLEQSGELDGLVLDLRNNPGGLLSQAVRVASVFLETGVVVAAKSRVQNQNQTYYAKGGAPWSKTPMIVLVNHGSAAGSEIVAAALQAHKRASHVGTHTFGRGTIQTIIPIGSQAALRLTTARVYAPTGSSLDLGLQPDLLLDAEPATIGVPSVMDPCVTAALRLLSHSDLQ